MPALCQIGQPQIGNGIVPGIFVEVKVAVDPELLEILVCPVCHVPVKPVHDGAGLKCAQCKRVYPVKDDDVPVMLVEEATVEE